MHQVRNKLLPELYAHLKDPKTEGVRVAVALAVLKLCSLCQTPSGAPSCGLPHARRRDARQPEQQPAPAGRETLAKVVLELGPKNFGAVIHEMSTSLTAAPDSRPRLLAPLSPRQAHPRSNPARSTFAHREFCPPPPSILPPPPPPLPSPPFHAGDESTRALTRGRRLISGAPVMEAIFALPSEAPHSPLPTSPPAHGLGRRHPHRRPPLLPASLCSRTNAPPLSLPSSSKLPPRIPPQCARQASTGRPVRRGGGEEGGRGDCHQDEGDARNALVRLV